MRYLISLLVTDIKIPNMVKKYECIKTVYNANIYILYNKLSSILYILWIIIQHPATPKVRLGHRWSTPPTLPRKFIGFFATIPRLRGPFF